MNCHEFWDDLPQKGRDITPAQAAHLVGCPACAAEWAPHRSLAAGLGSLGEEWRKLDAPSRVEAGLMAAFRTQAGFELRRSLARPWWTPVFAWAAAMAATIAMATLLIRGYQPGPVKPGIVASPRHTLQSPVEMASLDADSDDDTSALGEGFVRLPNTPRIEPNEDYNVVRVEVPGAVIIDAGISLAEDRAQETVLADVALGPDGTPRALRLVADGGTN
ncbi:MAG TPA: hypothetical protein VMB03_09190 [Bryobacteraceae bacterium]|nr:hypothetical protein [Bryobacteraceae bacterium]